MPAGPDQIVADTQIKSPDKPVVPKPVEKPKQPLGQTEAEMAKTIDSLGDGHAPDPDRSFRAILTFPLGKLREFGNRFKGETRDTKPAISEDEITQREKELGIETEEDRVIEASLLIDKKFMDTALITGQAKDIKRMFGKDVWAGWVKARAQAKNLSQSDLTPDIVTSLHKTLMEQTDPAIAGVVRNENELGGDYMKLGTAATYTEAQLQVLKENPALATYYDGNDPSKRIILYPNAGIEKGKLFGKTYALSEEGRKIYEESGQTTEGLIRGLLTDTCNWFNIEQQKEGHDPYQLAAELQRRLISIHPFSDGSGRLSRLMMNWSLEKDGLSPSILADPNDDILISQDQWIQAVKQGSENYQQIQTRKQEMEKAGIKDTAELMGLDEERTFNESIFRHIRKSPSVSENRKLLNHREFNDYLTSLRNEMSVFKSEFTADSRVFTQTKDLPRVIDEWGVYRIDSAAIRKDWDRILPQTVVHQGGLISRAYINSINSLPGTNTEYVAGKFFQEVPIYRGGIIDKELSDENICNMFTQFTGMSSSYRATGVEGQNTVAAIENRLIQQSLEDYNSIVAQSYLAKHHRTSLIPSGIVGVMTSEIHKGKKPFAVIKSFAQGDYFAQLAHDHKFGKEFDISNSPFSSASFNKKLSYRFAYKPRSNHEDNQKTGILIEARMPRDGAVLGFRIATTTLDRDRKHDRVRIPEAYERPDSDVSAIKKTVLGAEQSEIYVPGGIDPRSVQAINFYDVTKYDPEYYVTGEISKPMREAPIRAERSIIDGKDYVTITDYSYSRNPNGEIRKYIVNKSLKPQLIEEENPSLAQAA